MENGLLTEHWDVIEDEVTKEASVSGLPMFGDTFSTLGKSDPSATDRVK
jgi:hypothetical protein